MEKDKKKILAGAGILGGAGLIYLLTRKKEEEPPPPGEDYGRVQGYVLDAKTNAKLLNARVYIDGIFHSYTDTNGIYRTDYILFGSYTLTVEADNYQTGSFPITLAEGLMNQDLLLQPLTEAPTEWTEGVEVTKITVTPSTVYLGEGVQIDVYIQYPYPLEVPADIHGTVLVDGTAIAGDFHIGFRNPTLKFAYTPAQIGIYTARAQDKSASFTVVQDIVATYYPPFGGTRMPLCTEITVPNVEPFTIPGISHPGGDYVMEGVSQFSAAVGLIQAFPIKPVVDHLPEAYPTAWNPPGAVITNWVNYIKEYRIIIMAVEYECQPYWNSKEELAEMIARTLGGTGIGIPDEWKPQYGTTCPTCGGTGQVLCVRGMRTCRPGTMTKCPTCNGLGKVVRIDLVRGLRDWVKPIRYVSLCGGGYCIPRIHCPYCDANIDGPSHVQGRAFDMLSFVRNFLTHIETKHPNHPLTEPAWF